MSYCVKRIVAANRRATVEYQRGLKAGQAVGLESITICPYEEGSWQWEFWWMGYEAGEQDLFGKFDVARIAGMVC
jgi:hypothetical protein